MLGYRKVVVLGASHPFDDFVIQQSPLVKPMTFDREIWATWASSSLGLHRSNDVRSNEVLFGSSQDLAKDSAVIIRDIEHRQPRWTRTIAP
jgi:hypothetical protein